MAVGQIKDPKFANDVIINGQADLVAIGRGFLHNPRYLIFSKHLASDLFVIFLLRWAIDAAKTLGVLVEPVRQYRWTYRDLPPAEFESSTDGAN